MRISRIVKDYAIPLSGTFIFIIVLAGVLSMRYLELRSLDNFAQSNPLITAAGGELDSRDDNYDIETTDIAEITQDTSDDNTQQETPDFEEDTEGGQSNTGQNEVNDDSTNNTAPTQTEPPEDNSGEEVIFEAEITDLDYTVGKTQADSTTTKCSAEYYFGGKIRSVGGPGIIKYYWQRGVEDTDFLEESKIREIQADKGEQSYQVYQSWPVDSMPKFKGWVRLVLVSPQKTNQIIHFTHEC